MLGDIFSGIGSAAVGAIGSFFGGERRNQAQASAAQAANAESAAAVQKQIDFQREMSNSAYQRAVADMRKAGVNPMLASKVGGASTPGGAAYQAQMPSVYDTITPAIGAGMSVMQGSSAAERDRASAGLSRANTDKAIEEIKNIPVERNRLEAAAHLMYQQAYLAIDNMGVSVATRKYLTGLLKKIETETGIMGWELTALNNTMGVGAYGRQFKPAVDILTEILPPARAVKHIPATKTPWRKN